MKTILLLFLLAAISVGQGETPTTAAEIFAGGVAYRNCKGIHIEGGDLVFTEVFGEKRLPFSYLTAADQQKYFGAELSEKLRAQDAAREAEEAKQRALTRERNARDAAELEAQARAQRKSDERWETAFRFIFAPMLCLVGIFIYFLPTWIARRERKTNCAAIFVLNLFLGWTLLGWVVALVWALTKDSAEVLREQLTAAEKLRNSRS